MDVSEGVEYTTVIKVTFVVDSQVFRHLYIALLCYVDLEQNRQSGVLSKRIARMAVKS